MKSTRRINLQELILKLLDYTVSTGSLKCIEQMKIMLTQWVILQNFVKIILSAQ